MSTYLFDFRLLASLRISAGSKQEARKKLLELLDCAETNFGATQDGEPLIGEVSVLEDDIRLVEEMP